MLYRESSLVMNHLRIHPEFKDPESRRLYRPLLDDLDNVVQELEQIKPIIKEEYDDYQRMVASAARRESAAERQSLRPAPVRSAPRIVEVTDNVDYAVDLARDELRRRNASRRVSRPANFEKAPAQSRKEYWVEPDAVDDHYYDRDGDYRRDVRPARPVSRPGYEPHEGYRDNYRDDYHQDPDDDWRAGLEATRRTLDSMTSKRRSYEPEPEIPSRPSSHAQPYYPTTSRSRPVNYIAEPPTTHLPSSPRPQRPPKEAYRDDNPFLPRPTPPKPDPYRRSSERTDYYDYPPPRPPPPPQTRTPDLEAEYSHYSNNSLPPRPRKEPQVRESDPYRGSDSYERRPYASREEPPPMPPAKYAPHDLRPPEDPPSSKRISFRPAAYLENGDPVRYVFLPDQLRSSFLKIAAPNTAKGLETCGILCGTPVNNALFITCLLIPEQKSTPDTCETINETAMLDYCISEDLLVIGWIHTHPTQSCFMSSRDLHTQAGYQVMMPESIAIVCSPRHEPSYVVYP